MLDHAVARTLMITPSEPSPSHRPRAARERLTATLSAELATAWSRLAVAAASARGRHHRINEDSHSALDGIAPVFVVADGVGGGAMASWASRQLVARVHRRLERARIDADAIREALLDADRSIAKGIAQHSGTPARRRSPCAPAAGRWARGGGSRGWAIAASIESAWPPMSRRSS